MLASFRSDFYLLRGYLRTLLGVFACMMVFAFIQKSIYFAFFYPVFMAIFLPISMFSLSEQSGWEAMLLSAPVTRRGIVRGRYLACTIFSFGLSLIGFAYSLVIDFGALGSAVFSLVVALVIILLCNAVLLPVIYRFGPNKARFVFMAICIVPAMLLPLLMDTIESNGTQFVSSLVSLLSSTWFMLAVLAGSIALFVLSYLLSCAIYSKKEF